MIPTSIRRKSMKRNAVLERSSAVTFESVSRAGDGEFADDPAGLVEHGRQDDPAGLRHPGRQERRQPGFRSWPCRPVLGVVRDLREADPLAYSRNLARDAVP